MFPVPVFEGRDVKINIEKGMRNVPSTLPPFNGEIPYESLALIGYSTCVYARDTTEVVKSVALNAIWVVVLDCPSDV